MRSFLRQEDGASAVEYCLLVSFIALVIILAVQALGQNLQVPYVSMAAALK